MEISRRTILTSFGWKLMEKFSVQGISFVVSVFLARILCPEDYGIVALLLVFINLANVVIDGGLNVALIQKKNATQEDFSTIFWACFGMSVLLYCTMFVASPYIASFFNDEKLTSSVRVLCLCLFPYALNSVQRAYISRKMLFKRLFVSNLWATIASGFVGLTLAKNDFGHWSLIWFQITQATILSAVMWHTVGWRPSFTFSRSAFIELFCYGWKIFMSSMLSTIFLNVRSLLIGRFYTSATLAYFDRGKHLPALAMENINTSIQTVLFPAFSQEQDNKEKVRSMVSRSIRTCSLFILPVMMWLTVCARPIVTLMLTEKWLGAVPYIQLFCIAYMLMPIQIANIEAIKSQGRSDIILKLSVIKICIEVPILVVSVMIGPIAIAIGNILFNFICIFINLRPCTKLLDYGLRKQIADFLPAVAATLLMGAITCSIALAELPDALTLTLQSLVALLSYMTICYCFRMESFMYILGFIRKRQ